MKPSQYIAIRNRIQDAIAELNESIEFVRDQVDSHPSSSALRPATAEDVVPGAVIWYRKNEAGDWAWDEVSGYHKVWVGIKSGERLHISDCYVEDSE